MGPLVSVPNLAMIINSRIESGSERYASAVQELDDMLD